MKGVMMLRALALAMVFALVPLAYAGEPPAISTEDTLRWENLALKLQLHQERVQALQKDITSAQTILEAERKALDERFKDVYKLPLERLSRREGKWIIADEPKPEKDTKKK